MSHFKHHSLAILPLLTILSFSPTALMKDNSYRLPASVEEVQKEKNHPHFEDIISRVDKSSLGKDDFVDGIRFKVEEKNLRDKLQKEKESFKKGSSDKDDVKKQRESLEKLVVEVLSQEMDYKHLQDIDAITAEELDKSRDQISENKDLIEELLSELKKNEDLIADQDKKEEKKEEVVVVDDKKEEIKEEKKEVVKDEKKEEVVAADDKKEDKKEEKKEECAETKVLTAQVEELMKENRQIMMAMLNMSQSMMALMQQISQQQPNPFYSNSFIPYQYAQPFSSGNWVYYPQGFQPGQPNIFQQGPQMAGQGLYPDQAHMSQGPASSWNLMPQNQFSIDPRYTPMAPTPGNFGNDGFGFNMGAPQAPMMGQMPQPQMSQPQMPVQQLFI